MKRRPKPPQPMTTAEHNRMPKYTIGVVSRLLGLPPQMLRRYEDAGLVEPARQDGKNRLYSDQDITALEEIVELADQGVNAVGIHYILQMRKQVQTLKQEVQEAREELEQKAQRGQDAFTELRVPGTTHPVVEG